VAIDFGCPSGRSRLAVVLCRPENPENIGLAARAMKNTGFPLLRIVGHGKMPARAGKTAVHAVDILAGTRFFPRLEEAVADLSLVFAATAKDRKIGGRLTLAEAVSAMALAPAESRIGIVFGNERTGLTAAELRRANFVFGIPQAARQPSFNLAAAVLLTLHALFTAAAPAEGTAPAPRAPALPRSEQEAVIRLILTNLEKKRFIHGTNRDHVTSLLFDLLGRLQMTDKDRRLLLALFSKGVD
jgi:tRNA/rRNA methyltransferase